MNYYEKRMLEIGEMVSTPVKREALISLSSTDKLALLCELTDSKDFVDLLEFIKSAYENSDFCNSYR